MPTSSLVPHVWPLAINGTEYAIDDGAQVYEDRSIATLRNVATGSTSDETTLNPERGFLRSFTSFKRGAGQTFRDADDSDNQRFRDSFHVEVFDENAVLKPTRLVETSSLVTPAGSIPNIKEIFGIAYMTTGASDTVYRIIDPAATSPTSNSRSIGTGTTIAQIFFPFGTYLLVSTTTKIHYLPSDLSSNTDRSPANLSSVRSLHHGKGVTLMTGSNTGGDTGVFELTGDPTTAALGMTLIWDDGVTGGSVDQLPKICNANGGFFYGFGQTIHYISVDNTGVLTYQGEKANLGPGEYIQAMYEYLGLIFIVLYRGTGRTGIRMATQDTSGNLTIGALNENFVPTGTMTFWGNFAYAGLYFNTGEPDRTNGSSVGVGVVKMDLTQINDGLAPAWSFNEMYNATTPSGGSIAWEIGTGFDTTVNQQWLYMANGNQLYRSRTSNLTGTNFDSDGWLSTGWVSWGVGDDKLLQEVALDADSVTVAYSLPADVDSYTTYTNGDEVSDVALDLKFNVGATTSELRRATARAYPLTAPQREVTIPILLGDQVDDLRGGTHKRDPRAERDALVALEGTVVDLQEGQSTSVRALVTGHRWVGLNRENSGTFGGTLILTAKIL